MGYWSSERERVFCDWVWKGQGVGVQEEAVKMKVVTHELIVWALAVGGITEDRMGNMFEVFSDLVHASRFWKGFDEGKAGGVVGGDGFGDFGCGELCVMRDSLF